MQFVEAIHKTSFIKQNSKNSVSKHTQVFGMRSQHKQMSIISAQIDAAEVYLSESLKKILHCTEEKCSCWILDNSFLNKR